MLTTRSRSYATNARPSRTPAGYTPLSTVAARVEWEQQRAKEQVEQKAKDLIAKPTKGGRTATEEEFAAAARGQSEDPTTARNNGYLATPFKSNPNKPHGLYDRAETMQVGEVSDIPTRYGGNWYILRRGDAVPKTFEQAKPELLVSLRNQRGYGVALDLAKKAAARLKETKERI